ncbi:hypothetical protein [Marinitoga sp. 38H-ov]|uniref:hypothetical protein n=1 Tax=Marinitoga sp. 38H-ov TaxID=1755814 RepID=UPI0013EACA94|nr:hypothetical protein [Marinitoga sp. 38H-ov]KAF2955448.1 hypothetical protein AS160_10150 [Marinitoga sp. 38H-ov]
MSLNLNDLIDIIEYGAYAQPIVNYILLDCTDKTIEYYLLCLKNIWKFNYREAYKYAELTTTTTTTILKALATLEKISILFNNQKIKKANEELERIKNEIPHLNKKSRKIIIPTIRYIESRFYKFITDSGCRYWSKEYEKSDAQKSLLKYSVARKKIKKENYNKAYELFIEGYFLARKFPHPTMICAGLNSASWWIRYENKKKALIVVNLLEYYIGYYFENLSKIYNWLDTIFEVRRINNDPGISEVCNIVNGLKEFFNEINIDKKFNRSFYSEEFKRETKKIFKENIVKFKNQKETKIPELFFATYTALIEKPYFTKSRILRLIFEGDKDKIIKYFSRDYEKMYFFNLMLSEFNVKEAEKRLMNPVDFEEIKSGVSPFFIARKNLITELFKNVKNFKEFVIHYFELNDEEMKIFDAFLRSAVRYDIKWPITPYPKGKIKNFSIKYGLGQKRVALGYYSFEDNERAFLDSIIEKFLSV